MALTHSDQAVQGSVGSDSQRAPDPSYTSTRVHQYCQDTTAPANAHLFSAPPEHLGVSRERANSGVVGSIDNTLVERQTTSSPKGEASASGAATYARTSVDVRCVGTHFGDSDAASPRQGPGSSTSRELRLK
ncbi:uncharacterized protein F4807DRAFT_73708 [Annulohypoxylon truncatum]|uniref:uncharacterized protein n=1 Tax=Annulohypoxylon truncatum TaxID=327061 RepID=UPI0020088E4C|nr:uncharacterized protein F4807DRAFT_73708 [Annulohypoxylon truncatum]KAI1210234.1 hypothetical protein F4807DRAFT_73708 [Annulohypoxylon truncatum]